MIRLLRRALTAAGGLALAACLGLALFFPQVGKWLSAADSPHSADAIVVVNGGFLRPLHAAELYAAGLAPEVWLGRPEYKVHQDLKALSLRLPPPEEETYVDILTQKGVPLTAIHLFGNRHVSTVDEAEALRRAMGSRPARILLVTSPIHARRAKESFSRAYPEAVFSVVCDDRDPVPDQWWTDRDMSIQVVLESVKYVNFRLGRAFRSAAPSAPVP